MEAETQPTPSDHACPFEAFIATQGRGTAELIRREMEENPKAAASIRRAAKLAYFASRTDACVEAQASWANTLAQKAVS